ncbi:P-loop containing nucleoside triphosphate hydrolase [Gracilaria domingensis]|nr:P-loop containing nucleoside triphosphate hydrolase [Gracilaria domingensis]
MADVVFVELIAKGILSVIGGKFESGQDAIEATKNEVKSLSGNIKTFRKAMDQQLSTLNDKLAEVHRSIERAEWRRVQSDILESMTNISSNVLRDRLLNVSLALHTILHRTSCLQISVKFCAEQSSSIHHQDDDLLSTFDRTSATSEFASKLLHLNSHGLFSGMEHETDEPVHVMVKAVPLQSAKRDELISTTGALYLLCKILCCTIQDSRGVFAVEQTGSRFAQSACELKRNACLISLTYFWPTPLEFKKYERILRQRRTVSDFDIDKIERILNVEAEQMKVKNVYMLGETGEGKSTLGNALTGANKFYVSHAGTGTAEICGSLVGKNGLLHPERNIMVWDTPGLNDEDTQDHLYEGMLIHHLTRKSSVCTLIIVSKDGSRWPGSLTNTINVYRRAFGDAFVSCVYICIGLNKEIEKEDKISDKKAYWSKRLADTLGIGEESAKDRLVFYNAEQNGQEEAIRKIQETIWKAESQTTRVARTILRGFELLKEAKLMEQQRNEVLKASSEEFDALRTEILNAPRVRIKVGNRYGDKVESIMVELLPGVGERLRYYFNHLVGSKDDNRPETVFIFSADGELPRTLLSKALFSSIEISGLEKIRMLMRLSKKAEIVLKNEGETETFSKNTGRRVVVHNYTLKHLEGSSPKELQAHLEDMIMDPNVVGKMDSLEKSELQKHMGCNPF